MSNPSNLCPPIHQPSITFSIHTFTNRPLRFYLLTRTNKTPVRSAVCCLFTGKHKRRRERGWEALTDALRAAAACGVDPLAEHVRELKKCRRGKEPMASPSAAMENASSPQLTLTPTSSATDDATDDDTAAIGVVAHMCDEPPIDWAAAPAAVQPSIHTAKRAVLRETRKRRQTEGYSRILSAAFDTESPLTVVDFGCGTGNCTLPLAWRFPQWQFVGVDMKSRCIELLKV